MNEESVVHDVRHGGHTHQTRVLPVHRLQLHAHFKHCGAWSLWREKSGLTPSDFLQFQAFTWAVKNTIKRRSVDLRCFGIWRDSLVQLERYRLPDISPNQTRLACNLTAGEIKWIKQEKKAHIWKIYLLSLIYYTGQKSKQTHDMFWINISAGVFRMEIKL